MPFAGYKDFEECVRKNKGKVRNVGAYCASIHKKATGKWPTEKANNLPRGIQITSEVGDSVPSLKRIIKGTGFFGKKKKEKTPEQYEKERKQVREKMKTWVKEIKGETAGYYDESEIRKRNILYKKDPKSGKYNIPSGYDIKQIEREKRQKQEMSVRTIGGFKSPEPGKIPEKGKRLLAKVYAGARKKGMSKERASKIAWGAVKKAGLKKGGEKEMAEIETAKYMGFNKLKKSLAAKGARSPEALAAWIGRRKYGEKKFAKATGKDKTLKKSAPRKNIPGVKQAKKELSDIFPSAQIHLSGPIGEIASLSGAQLEGAARRSIGMTVEQSKKIAQIRKFQEKKAKKPKEPSKFMQMKEPAKIHAEVKYMSHKLKRPEGVVGKIKTYPKRDKLRKEARL